MQAYDVSCWDDYDVYIANKRKEKAHKDKECKSRKERERKIKNHNSTIKGIARHYGEEMVANPSALEKKMQQFLDGNSVIYDFQRPFLIKRNGVVEKFYIADFYIPSKNLIIETDGAFHKQQKKEDNFRTRTIQKHYPNIKVIRWRWHDFDVNKKVEELSSMIK